MRKFHWVRRAAAVGVGLVFSGCATVGSNTAASQSESSSPVVAASLGAQAQEPSPSEVSASPGIEVPAAESPDAPEDTLVRLRITAIGDVNFNRNRLPVDGHGVDVFGTMVPFEQFVSGLEGMIDGDLNFANIETVVTGRNDFEPPDSAKQYCFRSHYRGLEVMVEAGFNLFCLANNHAYDYGATGIEETLAHVKALPEGEVYGWSGIGLDLEEASRPALFEVEGVRVGFLAIGIAGNQDAQAREGHAGVAHVSRYQEALARLRDAEVDLRILSLHDGKEGVLYPTDRQLKVSREAISEYRVNLVIGHHPHRVQGVERYRDGLIFYSLGNGIMRGAADIGGRRVGDLYADFGLLIRIDVVVERLEGRVRFERVEAVPLLDLHDRPHPLEPPGAALRVETLNRISEQPYLEQDWNPSCPRGEGSQSVIFQPHGNYGVLESF